MLLANPDYAKYKAGGDEYTLLDSSKSLSLGQNLAFDVALLEIWTIRF